MLGETYPYYKHIKTPKQIGMSDKGTLKQTGKNIDGLIEYVSLLVSGKSKASDTGGPLGDRFFLKTGGTCQVCDSSGCKTEDRYIYIDNVPQGDIPFISEGLGVNFKEFRGLIPGAMGNLNALNPISLMKALSQGSDPKCKPITMTTIDSNNLKSNETHYVTITDIKNINPCSFPSKTNPETQLKCKEAFLNNNHPSIKHTIPISLGLLLLYIIST